MRRWLVFSIAIVLMVAMMVAVGATFWLRSFGAAPSGARFERMRRSSQFRDGKFRNPVPTNMLAPGSFLAMLRHQLFGDEERVPTRTLPARSVRLRHRRGDGTARDLDWSRIHSGRDRRSSCANRSHLERPLLARDLAGTKALPRAACTVGSASRH
jgi:hypothetical protein